MVVLDAVVPFALVVAFCLWQLWQLRRGRRPPPADAGPDDTPPPHT